MNTQTSPNATASLISRIQELAATLEGALVAIRRHQPGDPEREQVVGAALDALAGMIHDQGELVIRFTEAWPLMEVRLGAYPVPNPTLSNLGRKAFADGLRTLRLGEKLDRGEAARLLDMLATAHLGGRGEQRQQDLITTLWEADLRTLGIETGHAPLQGGDSQEGTFLSFADSAVVREIKTPLLLRAGTYLIWALEEEPDRREQVAPIFTEVVHTMVSRGDLSGAVELIREVDRARGLSELTLRTLQGALLPFRREEWVEGTIPILDSLGAPAMVAEFFHRLGPGTVPPLIHGLGRTEAPDILFDVLVQLARRDPRPFKEVIQSSDPRLQADILRVLAEVQDPSVAFIAKAMVVSRHPQLRCLALKVLGSGTIKDIRRQVWEALVDRSAQVRIAACRILEQRGGEADLEPLRKIARSRVFGRRDMAEKKVTLETLARLGGEGVVAILAEMLEPERNPTQAAEETAICAARALGLINSAKATQGVARGGNNPSPKVAQACRDALHSA